MEAIIIRLEAIAIRLEAMASRLEAIASRKKEKRKKGLIYLGTKSLVAILRPVATS